MFRIEMYKLIKLLSHFQGLKGNSYKINEKLIKDDLHIWFRCQTYSSSEHEVNAFQSLSTSVFLLEIFFEKKNASVWKYVQNNWNFFTAVRMRELRKKWVPFTESASESKGTNTMESEAQKKAPAYLILLEIFFEKMLQSE